MAVADYDDVVLQEIKDTNIQRLELVRRLKTTLEANIRTVDQLQRIRKENAFMESQIEKLKGNGERLKELAETGKS